MISNFLWFLLHWMQQRYTRSLAYANFTIAILTNALKFFSKTLAKELAWARISYDFTWIECKEGTLGWPNGVADTDDLSKQWRPIKMSKFCANIFLIQTTSNYFWASEFFKNQSQLFSFSQKKIPQIGIMD